MRVDVFYASAKPRDQGAGRSPRRAGVSAAVLPSRSLWLSLPYVARSWAILERSREASGLPLVFLLKTLIPLFALLMALQGVAQAIRSIAMLSAAIGRKRVAKAAA